MGFLNIALLLGLAAVAIPPLIHLLNRRRYDVVDWGAMQFLQISETKRRRILIEEVLLMALRMGLIALVVLALAAPFVIGSFLDEWEVRPSRDVVLIIDGSASMGRPGGTGDPTETAGGLVFGGTVPLGRTPHEAAIKWAKDFLDELA